VDDAVAPAQQAVSVAEPAATSGASAPASASQPAPVASTSTSHQQQHSEHQSRDREHSTVFVVGPAGCGMTDAALAELFKECGAIRESKVKAFEAEGKEVGFVEFVEAESVLAARTRDKKRFKGSEEELDVFPGVGSCLYVTNFPEEYDKEKLEGLFKPVSCCALDYCTLPRLTLTFLELCPRSSVLSSTRVGRPSGSRPRGGSATSNLLTPPPPELHSHSTAPSSTSKPASRCSCRTRTASKPARTRRPTTRSSSSAR
jgi:hypothetical protein